MVPVTFVIASLISLVCAEPIPRSTYVLETRPNIPAGFVLSDPAAADTTVELRIQVAQSNLAGLEQELYAVSTPSSDRYGQHLSKEQVEEYVKPTSDTMSLVNEWLDGEGITAETISPAGDWLQITVPINKANELLDAEFNIYTNVESGKQSIRTLSYSIPSNLKGHIDLIHPTIAFPVKLHGGPFKTSPAPKLPKSKPAANLTSRDVPSFCSEYIVPECLQALYGIPTTPNGQPSNFLGVSGFLNEYALVSDVEIFLSNFRTDIPDDCCGFGLRTVDGGGNPQVNGDAGLEASLDIQYTDGVATYVPITFISVGPDNTDGIDGFLDEINFLLGISNPPHVLTTSYGFTENEISSSLANSLCNAYMQLGARGVSILFSSGDGGVSGIQSESCSKFEPTFPSGCPYVTSVGATSGIPETSASFSSGGFSNIFSRPSYQSAAVTGYLNAIGSEYSGLFNPSGRAFPDISAQGVDVEIVVNTEFFLVDGTSCSSPIFTSIIALLNDRLITAKKSTLGFLNPFIYSTGASAFTDITTGSNPGCNTNGFPAIAGWDPVTGLGTPNWASLLTAVGL